MEHIFCKTWLWSLTAVVLLQVLLLLALPVHMEFSQIKYWYGPLKLKYVDHFHPAAALIYSYVFGKAINIVCFCYFVHPHNNYIVLVFVLALIALPMVIFKIQM